jgi:Rieske Fe-S protein
VARAPFSTSFDTGPCLRFPGQGQFHVLKYLKGLIQAIVKQGGSLYRDTHVTDFVEKDGCQIHTENGNTIRSHSLIVATCTPVNNRLVIHTKQAPYRTYAFAASIPKAEVPKGLYWDTADPYHYIRVHDDTIIIGGEDHRTGQDAAVAAKYDHLEKWARKRIPNMGEILYRWSGQVFEPADSLAFIGRNPGNQNIYIATGDSGNGLTHGTIAGMLIPDLILKKENPWKELYEPSRKTVKALPEFLHENGCSTAQYKDWLTPGEREILEHLPPNEGMIIRKGLKKWAVYKDKNNQIHIYSAVCPHLWGCVRWNVGEKSWDCPCHGSRFDTEGKVITGPSLGHLHKIK